MQNTAVETVTLQGASGKVYSYWFYPLGTQLKAAGGNYAFAYRDRFGRWVILYVGQTNDLSSRFDDHHKLPLARYFGATHLLAHLNANELARLSEERDLIRQLAPRCNG